MLDMTKRAVFSPAQNAALRTALLGLGYPSHAAAAVALAIKQQNVSRLLNDARAGFAYVTARRVAQLAGYDGVDAFFSAKGVLEDESDVSLPDDVEHRSAS